ncbi:MAG: acetylglutamate kinase [Thermoplasmata archaeon]|nr:acetylglutamate kinase [Thermoplasmata archaeon]
MIDDAAPWVLKVGGRELLPGPELGRLVEIVGDAVRGGRPVVVVHGGGSEITERASALGIRTEQRGGLRVTSDAMLDVVVEVLGGRVNSRLVASLTTAGVPAIGISGASGRLLSVVPSGDPPGSLGWVGDPAIVDARWLRRTLADGFTPVVAPIGVDAIGHLRNVNADLAAGAIASALHADLTLVTDVPAVRDGSGRALALLTPGEADRLVQGAVAAGGMIPKLDAAVRSLSAGARSVWIGDLEGLDATGPRPTAGTRISPRASSRPRAAASVLSPLVGAT